MNEKPWGGLHWPHDPETIVRHLSRHAGHDRVVVCELGIDTGLTGNRIVDFLKSIGVRQVAYYGVDDRSLSSFEKDVNHEVAFDHPEMAFVQGDRSALEGLEPIDFGFVDACHCAECVFQDSIAMSRAVRRGGFMAFHDTSLLVQYPNQHGMRDNAWQHYGSGVATRPLNVVEGIVMARALWDGEWSLSVQDGDRLQWGGIRIYEKL